MVPWDHVTRVVRSSLEPSEYVPVAVICRVAPSGTGGLDGVTRMEVSVGAGALGVPLPQEQVEERM